MANDHPFQTLFESFGRLPSAHTDVVNRKAYGELLTTLDVETDREGRCILLRAPRAGHGKTHLLSRIQHQLGGSHEFIPLHPSGSRVGAISVTEDALNRLGRALPAAGGVTVLDLVIRRLFSYALQPLVISGEVPCQDREGALSALRNRPVETFDFHHPNAVTAHWARENFEVLGPRLNMELAQRCGLPVREVSFWVSAFFRYAATPVDHPGRAGVLGMEVAGEPVTEGVAMERLTSLLALVSLLMRVVLVADDLEGFSADETAALGFAAFIGAIRHQAERVDVIISLNKDVWENAFTPRLSGGLADRLSEVLIELDPLSDDDIIALFDSRVPGLGKEVFGRIDASERHARGLIRAAGTAWMKAINDKAEGVPAVAPAVAAAMESDPAAEANVPSPAEPSPEEEEQPSFAEAPEPSPASFFTPVTDEPATGFFPAAEEEVAEPVFPSPQPWGGGSVYDAQVLDEPAREEPFSNQPVPDFLKDSSFFTPVAPEEPSGPAQPAANVPPAFQVASPHFQQAAQYEPAPPPPVSHGSVFEPVFQPVVQDEPVQPPPASGSVFEPVFEPASPAAGFGPPPPPQPQRPQPSVEGDDRVDDLLKQFRERYGR
ncbi:hypothetical protein OVA24_09575 [Luteolibacter sp. SL250]|uniref:hypothetical protein n=1 Tax=Luteolibacter sp. SL250 TaxID=2995170 RepID=UPI00226E973D|nr:hypothetical protein [Luteolibacter sp. SL250]WAC21633.1 hypothetical protein OVA24_09575 [Luteolibacter sp. SL250]